MAVVLPIVAQGSQFKFSTELDGVAFTFTFTWNRRDSAWYLRLGNGEDNPLAQGIRVVLRSSLLGIGKPIEGFPQGVLYAVDTTGQDIEPTQEDLGSRVRIYFFNAADYARAAL